MADGIATAAAFAEARVQQTCVRRRIHKWSCGMSATLAVIEPKNYPSYTEAENLVPLVCGIDSESFGKFVRDGVIGVAQKLVELKPYIEELWRRIDRGEVILGCSTKKEFCQQVLQRTPRAVRFMLDRGS
jgi:hypothetical protein